MELRARRKSRSRLTRRGKYVGKLSKVLVSSTIHRSLQSPLTFLLTTRLEPFAKFCRQSFSSNCQFFREQKVGYFVHTFDDSMEPVGPLSLYVLLSFRPLAHTSFSVVVFWYDRLRREIENRRLETATLLSFDVLRTVRRTRLLLSLARESKIR